MKLEPAAKHKSEKKRKGVKGQRGENVTGKGSDISRFADTFTPGNILGNAFRVGHYWEDIGIPRENGVIQAAGHIEGGQIASDAGTQIQLPKSQYPTMVYEAMGTDLNQCLSVYQESQRYPGNSICVFGFNARGDMVKESGEPLERYNKLRELLLSCKDGIEYGIDERFIRDVNDKLNWEFSRALDRWYVGSAVDVQQPYHLLYTCSFTWKKPAKADKGYDMPFVEARLLMMRNAAEIVGRIRKKKEADPSDQFLYRWMDGDATEDTTSGIPIGELRSMATAGEKGTKQVMTGRYDWRHEHAADGNKELYHQLIELLNESEKELRDYYYELVDRDEGNVRSTILRLQPPGNPHPNARASKLLREQCFFPVNDRMPLRKPRKGHYIPGYYLPETTMLMNQAAHNAVSYIDLAEDSQDQESMKILERIFCDEGTKEALPDEAVIYQPKLSVKKPLKHEFEEGTYLGKDMLSFLTKNGGDENAFVTALKNLRQSAWGGSWYFISDAKWNQWETSRIPSKDNDAENRQELFNGKRRFWEKYIWDGFLKDKNEEIQKEIVG